MKISPLTTALGLAVGSGVTTTAAMATTDKETARKIRMGANAFGIPMITTIGVIGYAGLQGNPSRYDRVLSGFQGWSRQPARLTGMSNAGQAMLVATGLAAGLVIANMAASMVLEIDKESLVG